MTNGKVYSSCEPLDIISFLCVSHECNRGSFSHILNNYNKRHKSLYRATRTITKLQQDFLGFVNVAAVLKHLHSVYFCRMHEVYADPGLWVLSFCHPGAGLGIFPAVYGKFTWCHFITRCTCSSVPVQRYIDTTS